MTAPRGAGPGMLRPARLRAGRGDGRLQGDPGWRAPDRPQAAVERTDPARFRLFRPASRAADGAGIAYGLTPTHLGQETLSHRYGASVAPAEIVATINASDFYRIRARPYCEVMKVQSPVGGAGQVDFCDHFLFALACHLERGTIGDAFAKNPTGASVGMTSIQTGRRTDSESIAPRARGITCASDGKRSEKRDCANCPLHSLRLHGSSLLHVAVGMTGESSKPPYSGTTCGASQL